MIWYGIEMILIKKDGRIPHMTIDIENGPVRKQNISVTDKVRQTVLCKTLKIQNWQKTVDDSIISADNII